MGKKLASFLKTDASVFLLFILIDLVFFWKYFLLGLIPIPADLVIGGYFPWLNDKWGYAVGVPVKNALMSDVVSLLYPWRLLAIESIKSGQLPLWDPTSFLGNTLVGNFQAGIFNPFNLLFLLPFDFNRIWGLQVVIQPLIAMICMFIMLRNWGVSKLSAVFGALSYALSAQVLVWIEYNVHSFILGVFPLLIFTIDKFLKTEKIYWLGGISLITAYIIFVGYPQHLYYFVFFGFIYFLLQLIKNRNIKDPFLKSISFGIAIAIGLLLSAITLLPGLEALKLSVKGLDDIATVNSVAYLPWQNLITGLIPDFFGNPATQNYFGTGYYESFIFYTSLVALPFVFIALSNLKKNKTRMMLLFLLATLVLALKNPLSEFIQNLSWLGLKGSVSSRILFVYGFAVSALAAIGLDQFRFEEIKKNYFKYIPIFMTSGIVLGIVGSIAYIKYETPDTSAFKFEFANIIVSVKNMVVPLAVIFSTSILIFLSRFIKRKELLIVFLLAIILFDYYRFSAKYLPFIDSKLVFPKTPMIDYLQKSEQPFRIAIERAELMPANTWSVYGIESISGYNIILPKDSSDFISFLNNSSISKGYSRVADISNFSSKLLDIANVKYAVVLLRTKGVPSPDGEAPFYIDKKKFQQIYLDGPVAIYENINFLNRFASVTQIKTAKDSNQTYELMNSDDFNFKNIAVLDNTQKASSFNECVLGSINYKSQNMSLDADCRGNGFLVFSQLFYPGWKAQINQNPVEIVRANGIFSGIYLSPGKSKIQISYFPDSFKIGLIISSITAMLFLGFMIFTIKPWVKK